MTKKRKKTPEFDLPPIILEAIITYLTQRTINKLTREQRLKLAAVATQAAAEVAESLEESEL